jgi:hypothetical protein
MVGMREVAEADEVFGSGEAEDEAETDVEEVDRETREARERNDEEDMERNRLEKRTTVEEDHTSRLGQERDANRWHQARDLLSTVAGEHTDGFEGPVEERSVDTNTSWRIHRDRSSGSCVEEH